MIDRFIDICFFYPQPVYLPIYLNHLLLKKGVKMAIKYLTFCTFKRATS